MGWCVIGRGTARRNRRLLAEAGKFLWNAINAAGLALSVVQGRSFDDYHADAMLRSAVERQLLQAI